MDHVRLGDLLVESGRLNPAQLEAALSRQTANKKLGQVLQEMGLLTEQEILQTLSEQLQIPCMKSDMFLADPQVVELLPESFARKHNVIPLFQVDNELTVAVSDPLDILILDEMRRLTGYRINCVVASVSAIQKALDEYYSVSHSIEDVISSFEDNLPGIDPENIPAVRLVNQVLYQAMKLNASDVHIETGERMCRVRFRIDGILHEIFTPPKNLGTVVTSRLKILAKLDISEKRLPQDGRFSMMIGERTVDVRLSTLPTVHGEKVVLRLLDKSSLVIGLDHIGLDEEEETMVRTMLARSYGLLLITGPTGSGKTTTLYSMIKYLNSPEKNIVTVEDPVEYEFDDINQVQVNPKVNLTFCRALRSILRQDPDIILIGEIRDEETASIAVRAALTGHFVLTTLHTNDAIRSIGRMLDMGVEPYLLASALTGVIAQRLVRTVCKDCVRYAEPDPVVLAMMGIEPGSVGSWAVAVGCNRCNYTGYKGRTALFEIVKIDDTFRQLILDSKSSVDIADFAARARHATLRSAGIKRVLQGVTTIQEIERVTSIQEI